MTMPQSAIADLFNRDNLFFEADIKHEFAVYYHEEKGCKREMRLLVDPRDKLSSRVERKPDKSVLFQTLRELNDMCSLDNIDTLVLSTHYRYRGEVVATPISVAKYNVAQFIKDGQYLSQINLPELLSFERSMVISELIYNRRCVGCHDYGAGEARSPGYTAEIFTPRKTPYIHLVDIGSKREYKQANEFLSHPLSKPKKLPVKDLNPTQRVSYRYMNDPSPENLIKSGLMKDGPLFHSIIQGYQQGGGAKIEQMFINGLILSQNCGENKKLYKLKGQAVSEVEYGVEEDTWIYEDTEIAQLLIDPKYLESFSILVPPHFSIPATDGQLQLTQILHYRKSGKESSQLMSTTGLKNITQLGAARTSGGDYYENYQRMANFYTAIGGCGNPIFKKFMGRLNDIVVRKRDWTFEKKIYQPTWLEQEEKNYRAVATPLLWATEEFTGRSLEEAKNGSHSDDQYSNQELAVHNILRDRGLNSAVLAENSEFPDKSIWNESIKKFYVHKFTFANMSQEQQLRVMKNHAHYERNQIAPLGGHFFKPGGYEFIQKNNLQDVALERFREWYTSRLIAFDVPLVFYAPITHRRVFDLQDFLVPSDKPRRNDCKASWSEAEFLPSRLSDMYVAYKKGLLKIHKSKSCNGLTSGAINHCPGVRSLIKESGELRLKHLQTCKYKPENSGSPECKKLIEKTQELLEKSKALRIDCMASGQRAEQQCIRNILGDIPEPKELLNQVKPAKITSLQCSREGEFTGRFQFKHAVSLPSIPKKGFSTRGLLAAVILRPRALEFDGEERAEGIIKTALHGFQVEVMDVQLARCDKTAVNECAPVIPELTD